MDNLQYEQYSCFIQSGDLSLDALKRIIRHDESSGWSDTPGGLARTKVLEDCLNGKIKAHKLYDEKGDKLYGIQWPLPLKFSLKEPKEPKESKKSKGSKELSTYYHSLTRTVSKPDNLSDIEKQIWDYALLGQSNVNLELVNDESIDAVKKELNALGLIKIKTKGKLIHADVPGGHKYINIVKARFPDIEDLNCNNPLFATYLKSLKQAISKAENLNPIEKVCCKELNKIYDQIKNTTNKWISIHYNDKTWQIIRNELLKVPNLKFKIGTIQNCCGEKEKIILIWNWNGQNPRLLKEDVSKYCRSIFNETSYLE